MLALLIPLWYLNGYRINSSSLPDRTIATRNNETLTLSSITKAWSGATIRCAVNPEVAVIPQPMPHPVITVVGEWHEHFYAENRKKLTLVYSTCHLS